MASVEPVVATIVGVVIYKEALTAMSAAGIVLVLAAIVLLNIKLGKSRKLSNNVNSHGHLTMAVFAISEAFGPCGEVCFRRAASEHLAL